jgi:transcriptional regulator with XRE-family HTH domain
MERRAPLDLIAAALRRERGRTGLSLSEMARRAGIAKSTLSQLEAGTGNPSVETLWALGVALNVPFSRLVEPAAGPLKVIRAGEGPAVRSEKADYVGSLLAACPPGARRDLYSIAMQPGAARAADPHLAGCIEHIVVINGKARVGPAGNVVDLAPGDYATFPGDVPHVYEALVKNTSLVLVMEYV